MAVSSIANGEARAVAAAWTAIPEEGRAVILAGEAAMVNRRRLLDDWIAIGKAFYELRAQAMRQSDSKKPRGRRYGASYARLELSPEIASLHEIKKSDRAAAIWLYENGGEVRLFYATLSQTQLDRWTRPQTIKSQHRRASQQDDGESKPATKRPSARDQEAEIVRLRQELDAAEDKIQEEAKQIYDAGLDAGYQSGYQNALELFGLNTKKTRPFDKFPVPMMLKYCEENNQYLTDMDRELINTFNQWTIRRPGPIQYRELVLTYSRIKQAVRLAHRQAMTTRKKQRRNPTPLPKPISTGGFGGILNSSMYGASEWRRKR